MLNHAATTPIRDISRNGQRSHESMPKIAQEQHWLGRYFTPRPETKVMAEQTSRGVFLPYPLLGMLVTIAIVLISGLVALEVQVSNLSTTLLLRDGDHARQVSELHVELGEIKGKNEQLQVYIHDDREKLVEIKTRLGIK